jgi:hypothetical protein
MEKSRISSVYIWLFFIMGLRPNYYLAEFIL